MDSLPSLNGGWVGGGWLVHKVHRSSPQQYYLTFHCPAVPRRSPPLQDTYIPTSSNCVHDHNPGPSWPQRLAWRSVCGAAGRMEDARCSMPKAQQTVKFPSSCLFYTSPSGCGEEMEVGRFAPMAGSQDRRRGCVDDTKLINDQVRANAVSKLRRRCQVGFCLLKLPNYLLRI